MEKTEVSSLKNIEAKLLSKFSKFAKSGISDSIIEIWTELHTINKDSEAVDSMIEAIEEKLPVHVQFVKVLYGRKYKGLDVTGDVILEPLYAYSEKQIMDATSPFIRSAESMYGAGSKEVRKARQRQQRLLAEFAEKMAAAKLVNDEAGITKLEEWQRTLGKLYWEKSEQLISARAQSPAGILCQFLRLCDWLELKKDDTDDTSRRLAESIASALYDLIDSGGEHN